MTGAGEATQGALSRARGRVAAAVIAVRRRRAARVALRTIGVVVVSLAGVLAATALAGGVTRAVGPLDTSISFAPSLHGGTHVAIPPLGSLRMRDHAGPVRLQVRVTQLRAAAARQLLRDPASLETLPRTAADDVRQAVGRVAVRTGVAAVGGALLLGAIVYRRWRPAVAAGGVAVLAVASSYGVAAATFDPHALAEPRFYGLLSDAPALVGDARDIVTDFDRYSAQLARLTGNVTRLYDAASTLPTYEPNPGTLRVLHVSDIHDNPEAFQIIRSVIAQFHVDAVIDSGDITDHGSRVEDGFVLSAGRLGVPYVWVRGNHDSAGTQRAMARQRAVVVLDGTVKDVLGLRVFGVGDPRFTPDKTTRNNADERQTMRDFGERTAGDVRLQAPVDIAVVHDPAAAVEVLGAAPVVLTGHLHKRVEEEENGSIMLVEGSTGGAGLRGLEGEDPTPLECSVLYFDRVTHRLQAYDEITIGGLGTSSARIARHVVAKPG